MGVQNQAVYSEVKRLFEIPDDEPIFILRGQDILYQPMLAVYEQLYLLAARTEYPGGVRNEKAPRDTPQISSDQWQFADHVAAMCDNGRRWQRRNSLRVKLAD